MTLGKLIEAGNDMHDLSWPAQVARTRADALREAATICDRIANDQSELGDMNGYRAILKARAAILRALEGEG